MEKESAIDFKLLKIKDDKYYMKVNNIDVPVEVNEYVYKKWKEHLESN